MKIYQLTVDLHVRVRGKGVVHVKSLITLLILRYNNNNTT